MDTQKRLSAQEAQFIKQKEDSLNATAVMQKDMDRSAGNNLKSTGAHILYIGLRMKILN